MTDIKIDPGLCKRLDIKLMYLFGSRAKGTAAERSDFDIAVVFEENPADPLALEQIASLSIELDDSSPAKLDIVSLNHASSLLKYEVISNGYPLYCADEKERINFEVSTIKEYIDDQFMRDIYTRALVDRINKGVF